MNLINESLKLPCGAVLKNRLAKSAMSENMALNFIPDAKFSHLYKTWANGGTGLLISGNVMFDPHCLGEPKNVVIDEAFLENEMARKSLKEWALAGTINNTHLWMQINHPGKQSPRFLTKTPIAPSSVPLKAPLDKMFNTPRELSENEIFKCIDGFTKAAVASKEAGFTGVQIHGAHGYLVSQFLSPLHNKRNDQWGGSLNNRMRFALMIYQSMRKALGDHFPISIKLNSADFQKGGFSEEESLEVVKILANEKIDLIEISGGSYESQVMMGTTKESTLKREAYFLDYCEKIRSHVSTPLMLTGGFRSLKGMNEALESRACDVIGLARSLALNPNFSNELLSGDQNTRSLVHPLTTGFKAIDQNMPLEIVWYTEQIHRMGNNQNPDPKASALSSIVKTLISSGIEGIKRVRG